MGNAGWRQPLALGCCMARVTIHRVTASSPIASDVAREVRCPRCGYDQRGVIGSWIESCPMNGVCAECGLPFAWCEVMQPEKFEPRWCIEFEPRARRLPWAAMRTVIRACWPWGFWSRLKMSDAICWARLCAFLMLLVIPLLLAFACVQGVAATRLRDQIQSELLQLAQQRPMNIANLQRLVRQLSGMPPSSDASYNAALQSQITSAQAEVARLQALGNAVETIDASWSATTWDAVSQPWSKTSSARIVAPGGTAVRMYPSPRMVLDTWLPMRGNWGNPWDTRSQQRVLIMAWIGWGGAMTLLLPLSFVLMPFSMRKAKVRWGHIVRVTIYSLWIPLVCLLVGTTLLTIDQYSTSPGPSNPTGGWARYAPWLAVTLWWQAATSRYLKIPHAWLTIGLLTLLCLLTLLGMTAAISTRLTWEMLDLFHLLIR